VTPEQAIDLGREALYMTLIVCTPILLAGLVVGLAVSILQAVTQIQEQTLSFVPKIIAMMVALMVCLPWLTARLMEYAGEMFSGAWRLAY
jgi:flagellar biosynthesis protein FliQ